MTGLHKISGGHEKTRKDGSYYAECDSAWFTDSSSYLVPQDVELLSLTGCGRRNQAPLIRIGSATVGIVKMPRQEAK
jgi:hypothetical protein